MVGCFSFRRLPLLKRERVQISAKLSKVRRYFMSGWHAMPYPHSAHNCDDSLSLMIAELGLCDGQELAVADVTTPQTVLFKLHLTS